MKKRLKIIILVLLFFLLFILTPIAVIGYMVYVEIGCAPNSADVEKFALLDYFKNGEFQSPEPTPIYFDRVTGGGGWASFILGSFFRSSNAPKTALPQVKLDRDSFGDPSGDLAAYWLGHSTLVVEIEGKRILVDPVFGAASPVAFAMRRYQPAPLDREDLPALDYVLITHDHYDHLEYSTVRLLSRRGARFITPLGVGSHLVKWGVKRENIVELGWGEKFYDGAIEIAAERAIHFSGRTFATRNKSLWASYAIAGEKRRDFISGDSGYGKHFKAIGEKYGGFDLAFIEIDAWNEGWPKTHSFPREVISAYYDLNAKTFMPIHWGVFDLAYHKWNESITMIDALAKEAKDINLLTPIMGEKVIYGETVTKAWYNDIE
jgi:L-ascorbate metabolism protein UlaG (beta-lactamase superfamily)